MSKVMLREWLREFRATPPELFELGATEKYIPEKLYYDEVLPLFVDQERRDPYGRPYVTARHFRQLVRASVIDVIGYRLSAGADQRFAVHDSRSTRQRLRELANLPTTAERSKWVFAQLLTRGCPGAWGVIVDRVKVLQDKFSMEGWHILLDEKNQVDLAKYLRLGQLLDAGTLPINLMITAMQMGATRLLHWLRTKHESGGEYNGKPIKTVYKSRQVFVGYDNRLQELIYLTPCLRPGNAMLSVVNLQRQLSKAKPSHGSTKKISSGIQQNHRTAIVKK